MYVECLMDRVSAVDERTGASCSSELLPGMPSHVFADPALRHESFRRVCAVSMRAFVRPSCLYFSNIQESEL